ncbi:MAG: uroporphyrinogen decarboxylase family protein, partial [Chloroflexota bacterium]|nr:uroporphyrinogen decarboxylase family protein [Chloroflexota bacterium]
TQYILPNGTPEQVRADVEERVSILAPGGGFIFAPVHNILADVPAENVLALYNAFRRVRDYPVRRSV